MDTLPVSLELLAPSCDREEVLCTGSWNDWITTTGVVRLKRKSPGYYVGKAQWPANGTRYKYFLGDWDHAELDEWGTPAGDRHFVGQRQVRDAVPQFATGGKFYNPAFLPTVERLPPNLPIPEPFATRRIAALLPHDYNGSGRRYPVLYLQDGQNLFDEFAPYGNWEVDKRLAWLAERGMGDVIVLAIDHAEEKRISEFAPPTPNRVGQGVADGYAEFLVKHLKPLIDRTYRTLPDRSNTAVGGSSMGALASLYVAMTRPAVFGRAMLLSPSIWVDQDLAEDWQEHDYGPTRVWLYGGMDETPGSAATFGILAEQLRRRNTSRRPIYLDTYFNPAGKHTESAWGATFPRAVTSLFR